MAEKGKLDPTHAPLTDYERYLSEKLLNPSEVPQAFKAWVADYVALNGDFHVDNLPTLRGEDWRYVGATGQPAFSTNVVNFDGGTPPNVRSVRFAKDAMGFVHLQGLVGCAAAIAAGGTLFTLPEGYRPYTDGTVSGSGGHYVIFPTAHWNGGGVLAGFVQIDTNGAVHTVNGLGAAGHGEWLDGIHFRAA